MIAYRKTAGVASDLRFVADDYQPAQDEILIAGDVMPEIDTLSDPAVIAASNQARLLKSFETAVQGWLDAAAQARGYDGILSAATYATSKDARFGPEGIAFRDWRDAVWNYCYAALADVQAGKRPVPDAKQLLSELPPAPVFS